MYAPASSAVTVVISSCRTAHQDQGQIGRSSVWCKPWFSRRLPQSDWDLVSIAANILLNVSRSGYQFTGSLQYFSTSVLVIVRHLSYLGHLLREYQAVIKPRAVYHLIIIYRNNELLNVSMIECFFDMASTSQQLSPVIQQIRQH